MPQTLLGGAPIAFVLLDLPDDPFGAASRDGRGATAFAGSKQSSVGPSLGRAGRANNDLVGIVVAPGLIASNWE